jgi:hypothetical protein
MRSAERGFSRPLAAEFVPHGFRSRPRSRCRSAAPPRRRAAALVAESLTDGPRRGAPVLQSERAPLLRTRTDLCACLHDRSLMARMARMARAKWCRAAGARRTESREDSGCARVFGADAASMPRQAPRRWPFVRSVRFRSFSVRFTGVPETWAFVHSLASLRFTGGPGDVEERLREADVEEPFPSAKQTWEGACRRRRRKDPRRDVGERLSSAT